MKRACLCLLATVAYVSAIPSTDDDVMFGFGVKNDSWVHYPLGKANGGLTHMGVYNTPSPALLAKAEELNVTLVTVPGEPPYADWPDAAKRAAWINGTVATMVSGGWKGVTCDIEGNGYSKAEKQGMVSLVGELQTAVTAAVGPAGSVSTCVGGRPGYELRNYDYAGLAAVSDFLFIMSYDMEFWDDYTCLLPQGMCSQAPCPLPDAQKGIAEYLGKQWGVPARKLVLGVPWYGVRYKRIVGVPFNEGEVDYGIILDMDGTKSFDAKSSTNVIKCPGICKGVKSGTEVWYDDAKSLKPKYAIARDNGLRGVGMWTGTALDYSGKHQAETDAMWASIMAWNNATA